MLDVILQSLFSPVGLFGHMAYLLLIISMMMRDMVWLRLIAVASGLAQIAFDAFMIANPVGAMWDGLLVAVNLVQLAIMAYHARMAVFSPEERDFWQKVLPGLAKAEARRLLNLGLWIDGAAGTELTRQGEPVERLQYLVSGEAQVHADGHPVAVCREHSFIGEMTSLSGDPATASVTLSRASRYLSIDTAALRKLVRANIHVRQALEAAFSRNMREKLVVSNRLLKEMEQNGRGT